MARLIRLGDSREGGVDGEVTDRFGELQTSKFWHGHSPGELDEQAAALVR
jgi:hypothetical protein